MARNKKGSEAGRERFVFTCCNPCCSTQNHKNKAKSELFSCCVFVFCSLLDCSCSSCHLILRFSSSSCILLRLLLLLLDVHHGCCSSSRPDVTPDHFYQPVTPHQRLSAVTMVRCHCDSCHSTNQTCETDGLCFTSATLNDKTGLVDYSFR